MTMSEKWHYFKVGTGENGYPLYARVTESGREQPYCGMRTCQNDAKRHGAKAVFHETESLARQGLNEYV